MLKLTLHTVNVCLPDYWNGTTGLFLGVPVWHDQSAYDVVQWLKSELSAYGFYGREGDRKLTEDEKDSLFAQCCVILDNLFDCPLTTKNPFGLEVLTDEELETSESCYLYITFKLEEE